MTANVWNPGQGAIPVAQSKQTMLAQAFTAIDAQVLFNLTAFNYTVNTSSLLIAINGVMQIPGVDFTETSGSSFTITTPLVAGDVVLALGFVGVTATDASLTVIKNATQLLLDTAAQKAIDAANAASAASGSATTASTYAGNALASQNAAAISASQVAGAFEGMRNRIINGSCIIAQRTSKAVDATLSNYAGADRIIAAMVSGTGITQGSIATVTGQPALASSIGQGIVGVSCNAGALAYFATKIESIYTKDLNSKNINFSCKFYQDAVASLGMVVRISKFNAADTTSSGNTAIFTSGTINCPTGVFTPISVTCALGAADANNGLIVEVYSAAALGAVVNKSFVIGDMQLEIGTTATTPQVRPYGVELLLCQRYYEQFMGVAIATASIFKDFYFKATKRTTPTITLISQSSGSGLTFTCNDATRCYQEGVNSVPSNFIAAASAEIL